MGRNSLRTLSTFCSRRGSEDHLLRSLRATFAASPLDGAGENMAGGAWSSVCLPRSERISGDTLGCGERPPFFLRLSHSSCRSQSQGG